MIRNGTRQRKYAAVPRAHPSGWRRSTIARECAKRRAWKNKTAVTVYSMIPSRHAFAYESVCARARVCVCLRPRAPFVTRHCNPFILFLYSTFQRFDEYEYYAIRVAAATLTSRTTTRFFTVHIIRPVFFRL